MLSLFSLRFFPLFPVRLLCLLCLSVLLAGCASQSDRPLVPAGIRERIWQQHKLRVAQLTDWQMTGRVGLGGWLAAGSATVHWQQQPECFSLSATTILGQTLALFQGWTPPGRPERALLRVAGQPPVAALSADTLLRNQTGLDVSMEGLSHWIRGLPAPGAHRKQLDNQGHLRSLEQQGWRLVYEEYRKTPVALPVRIRVAGHGIKLVISVQEWNLAAGARCPRAV